MKWKLNQDDERKVKKMSNKNGASSTTVASKFNVHLMTMQGTLNLTFLIEFFPYECIE